jgi:6-pyruvoyltetrahydropterin/6-carboxytetrahydropterin synthase
VKVELSKSYRVQAAHSLPCSGPEHKCRKIHGHNYRIEIFIYGEVDESTGWLADFGVIDTAMEPLRKQIDHHMLNEVKGLENPTSENIAGWLWERLKKRLPNLSAVKVRENESVCCTYRGE